MATLSPSQTRGPVDSLGELESHKLLKERTREGDTRIQLVMKPSQRTTVPGRREEPQNPAKPRGGADDSGEADMRGSRDASGDASANIPCGAKMRKHGEVEVRACGHAYALKMR